MDKEIEEFVDRTSKAFLDKFAESHVRCVDCRNRNSKQSSADKEESDRLTTAELLLAVMLGICIGLMLAGCWG